MSEKNEENKEITGNFESWRCMVCKTLLGRVISRTLHVKYKDMYIEIHSPASVSITCRGCGRKINKDI